MAFRERNVVGFVFDANGDPVSGAQVQFKTDKPVGYTSTHVIIDRVFEAVTANDGSFSASVWCDQDSLVSIDYGVFFPVENDGPASTTHTGKISVAYGDGSVLDIGTAIAAGLSAQVPATNGELLAVVQSIIDDLAPGAAIGSIVQDATPKSVLLVDADGKLAEANSHINWSDTPGTLFVRARQLYAPAVEISGFPGSGASGFIGFSQNDYTQNGRGPVVAEIGANQYGQVVLQGGNGVTISRYPDLSLVDIKTADANTDYTLKTTVGVASKVGQLIALAAGQAADAIQVKGSGSSDSLFSVGPTGTVRSEGPTGTYYHEGLTIYSRGYNSRMSIVQGPLTEFKTGGLDGEGLSICSWSGAIQPFMFYIGYTDPIRALIRAVDPGSRPLVLKLATGQTANALEIRNDAGTVIYSIDAAGSPSSGSGGGGVNIPTDGSATIGSLVLGDNSGGNSNFISTGRYYLQLTAGGGGLRFNSQATIINPYATSVPISIELAAGQTANAFEVKNSGGTIKAQIDPGGVLYGQGVYAGNASLLNWGTEGSWLNFSEAGLGGIGTGGFGQNVWIARAVSAGQFLPDVVNGDLVYRNIAGAMRFGNDPSTPAAFVIASNRPKFVAGNASLVPLTVELAAAQSANAFEIKNSADAVKAHIDASGAVRGFSFRSNDPGTWLSADYGFLAETAGAWFRAGSAGQFTWDSGANGASLTPDAGLARASAGVVKVTNGAAGRGSLEVDALLLMDGTLKTVVVGPADSAGAGYKSLRVAN